MKNSVHEPFSLYNRKNSPFYYVQFWDEESQKYASGRSTEKTTPKEARILAMSWLAEFNGPPPLTKKNNETTIDDVTRTMYKFLKDNACPDIDDNMPLEDLLSKVSILATGTDFNSGNPIFIDYVLSCWDWDHSDYVRNRLESGKSIGKTYCQSRSRYVQLYALDFFKDVRIRSVTTSLLEKFKASLPRKDESGNGLELKTINEIMGCLTTPLREAKRLGIIHGNPGEDVVRLSSSTKRKGILTIDEANKLFTEGEWLDIRSKVASQIASIHGLRLGEVNALQIQDINPETNEITIRHSWEHQLKTLKCPKNGHERIIYTLPNVIALLTDLFNQKPIDTDFIFWSTKDPSRPMNYDAITRHFVHALESIGIKEEDRKDRNISFHSWRHFNNSVLRDNVSDSVLRATIGHQSEEMTEHYYHVTSSEADLYRSTIKNIIPATFWASFNAA